MSNNFLWNFLSITKIGNLYTNSINSRGKEIMNLDSRPKWRYLGNSCTNPNSVMQGKLVNSEVIWESVNLPYFSENGS